MSYWLYGSESPLSTKPSASITDARVRAVNFLIRHKDKEIVNIVKANDEPYRWRMNYTNIGKVYKESGKWVFKPKDEDERNFNPKTGALLQGMPSNLVASIKKFDPKSYKTIFMRIPNKGTVKVKDFKQALSIALATVKKPRERYTFYLSNVNNDRSVLWTLFIYDNTYYFVSNDIRNYYDMNGKRFNPPKNSLPWLAIKIERK